jgi:predicted nuclease of predicted toxin-antitoxin system
LGLSDAPDAAIWQHALQHNMAVISKDEDYLVNPAKAVFAILLPIRS